MTDGFVISGIVKESNKVIDVFPGKQTVQPMLYNWRGWEEPVYKERLKKSYEIIRQYFGKLK